jgi:hypothetical protein
MRQTEVGVNSWVLHYDKEVFGEDCDKLRPKRWLDCSDEQLRRMNGHYIPVSLPAIEMNAVTDGDCC